MRPETLSLFAAVIAIYVAIYATDLAHNDGDRIDKENVARAHADACRSSIVTMHTKLIALRRGYELGPSEKALRLADWDEAMDAVSLVQIACIDQIKASGDHFQTYEAELEQIRAQYAVAYRGLWDETDARKLIDWSNEVIGILR
ncbi:hypothetical protein [Microbacterium capsulatum]|uniref:Uncharacterized protein n=1 Tax=Microbacterium capsulatum TaxID=3041921 RepID=A0ABU0XF36_9MICO|nr:hypothetical protein [Microbacterium sp. ASV81]MDQ4213737.1 hypothetical protein [Microbacterium sp. ASV81]